MICQLGAWIPESPDNLLSEPAWNTMVTHSLLMQLFWFVPLNQTILITYNSSDIPRQFVGGKQPATAMGPSVMAQSTIGRRLLQGELPSAYLHLTIIIARCSLRPGSSQMLP